MRLRHRKALLAVLLAGMWLPATITCDPGSFDGVIHVVADGWNDGVVVVDDGCGDCWFGDCCGGGFSFDFFHHGHDDD